MPLKKEERGSFEKLLRFVHSKSSKTNYHLVFEDKTVIKCTFDTDCESDNCLDLDDPNYEEYWMIIFKNLATGKLFEVNYHNMPIEVWCDGKKLQL